jgi:hypothetical protein
MIPKIVFTYSWIYHQLWKKQLKYDERSINKFHRYIKKVERYWNKHDKKILKEISKVSGLKWKEKTIKCYIVEDIAPFSDPLTISIYDDITWFVDSLTHELIHQIFIQNEATMNKSFDYLFRKYKKEPLNTVIHIPVHAIHAAVFLKVFGKKRLNREINIMKKYAAYGKSWKIVQNEGHENIIKEFSKRYK